VSFAERKNKYVLKSTCLLWLLWWGVCIKSFSDVYTRFVDIKSSLQTKTTCPEHSNVVFVDSWSLVAGLSTNHQSADNRTGQMSRVVPRYSDISQDDNTWNKRHRRTHSNHLYL